MRIYHKIKTVWARDPDNNYRTLIEGQWALPEFAYLAHNEWIFTEKVHGTNIRIMFDGDSFRFGGRTENSQMPTFLYDALAQQFLPMQNQFQAKFPGGVCLYGEGYGSKIQNGGGNYRDTPGFVLFDIMVGEWWLRRNDCEEICKEFDIDIVPIIGCGSLEEMVDMVRGGLVSEWGSFQAEGIVAKPSIQLFNRKGKRVITKIKCADFQKE